VSPSSPATTFVSCGRLSGVLQQRPALSLPPQPESRASDDLDTREYEAVYYRARLILGDDLPRPPRLQSGAW
jgi:hypothetical protein